MFRKLLYLLLLSMFLWSFGLAEAKPRPCDWITINGWGLPTEGVGLSSSIAARDPHIDWFVDIERKVEPPTNLGVPYTITGYCQMSHRDEGPKVFIRLLYFADPGGERSYVLYQVIRNGSWQYWPYREAYFRVPLLGESTLRQTLVDNGVWLFDLTGAPRLR